MGWSGLIETAGLAEEKRMKTAHPSQIQNLGLFWRPIGVGNTFSVEAGIT